MLFPHQNTHLKMVFIRWNRAGVAVAVSTIWIICLVEIEHQFIVDDVFDAQIKVAATAIGAFSIAEVLEGDKEVIAVLGQGIAQTAVNAELMLHSVQIECGNSVLDIRASDPTIGWQFKWLGIGGETKLAGYEIALIGGKKLHTFEAFFVQR